MIRLGQLILGRGAAEQCAVDVLLVHISLRLKIASQRQYQNFFPNGKNRFFKRLYPIKHSQTLGNGKNCIEDAKMGLKFCRLQVGSWRLEVGGWKLEVGGWRLEVGGWKLEVGSWRLEVGSWRLEVGGWKLEVGS